MAAYDQQLRKSCLGELPPPLQCPIELRDSDPTWPQLYDREAARIRSILGDRVVRLEHAGSTSVPGLSAKPIIDIVLEVPDAADEAAYAPAMEAVGYVLRIRQPDWFQHRLFKGPDTNINLHVFSANCADTDRPAILGRRAHLVVAGHNRASTHHAAHPAQASMPAALANLTEVVTAGQQHGTVDNSAAALLQQAQDVTRAVQEGKTEDARKKLRRVRDVARNRWPLTGQLQVAGRRGLPSCHG